MPVMTLSTIRAICRPLLWLLEFVVVPPVPPTIAAVVGTKGCDEILRNVLGVIFIGVLVGGFLPARIARCGGTGGSH
jgi:hypothetical protein